MSLPPWDDDMKFELLRLKSELKPENFRVLHAPIGLGLIKREPETSVAYPHLKPLEISSAAPTSKELSSGSRGRSNPLETAKIMAAVPKLPPLPAVPEDTFMRRTLRRFFVHSLDLMFVSLTLGVGLLLATWLVDPRSITQNPKLLSEAFPLRYLTESSAGLLVLGLYAFFSLYWLFFKLVSGSTLGESFLDNFRTLQNPRRSRSIKDSGDS